MCDIIVLVISYLSYDKDETNEMRDKASLKFSEILLPKFTLIGNNNTLLEFEVFSVKESEIPRTPLGLCYYDLKYSLLSVGDTCGWYLNMLVTFK